MPLEASKNIAEKFVEPELQPGSVVVDGCFYAVPGFGKMLVPVNPKTIVHGPTDYRILDQELQRRGIHPLKQKGGEPEDGRFRYYGDTWALKCWQAYRDHYGAI